MKFNEAQLEKAIIEFIGEMGYPHLLGKNIYRQPDEVLIKDDLRTFLSRQYAADGITLGEIESVIRQLEVYSSADLYESNKAIMKLVSDGFLLKREDRDQKDLYVKLIDYSALIAFRKPKAGEVPEIVAEEQAAYGTDTGANIFKMVNQLEITGHEKRIPDGILYINGLPLVVFEFKSAIREEATIHDAFIQLTVRYQRDIPELFKYNAFCVISDGVNNKAGSFFAAYEFFYAWRKTDGGDLIEKDGIDSLYSMIHGLFHPVRLCDVIRNFIFLPDTSRREEKILCRYPQYYAATKLYQNILNHIRPEGDGKGGTYFGVTEQGVKRTFGFAKYLHDALPNATYVGFTGTPVDATLNVFGEVVDAYTMTESVADEITVRIVYEGRAAKVVLDNSKLEEIEAYYAQCGEEGAGDYAIDASKRANLHMDAILGDPDRRKSLAADFVAHYEARIEEGSTVAGKAMFVCKNRLIAYALYKEVIALRPEWAQVKVCAHGETLTQREQKEIMPMARIKLVMTRGKDDDPDLYKMLGTKADRKELDRQFKNAKSNFKIAMVVDMWLTGFDVPFLDTMYINKPVQRHSLIQTISRVNRKYLHKEKGLIVDYIGIKKQMNLALAHYAKTDTTNFEDIKQSVGVVKDHLDLMQAIFYKFDTTPYFSGEPTQQLHCLNMAAELIQQTDKLEKRFMALSKRMKAAYDICVGSDLFTQDERDRFHFYMAVRAIIFKLTKGNAPDLSRMNARVRQMLSDALKSDGVEEIFKMGQGDTTEVNIFDPDYLEKINKIKLPNTKIKMLQKLLSKAIDEFKKVNKLKGVDFAKKFKSLVERYNDRSEQDVLRSEVLEDFTDEIIDLYHAIRKERESFADMGIDFEEKAFYDILKTLTIKYDFEYPENQLITLAQKVKVIVDDKAKYTDWSQRDDIKAELKVDLIILLAEHGYPPVDRDEVYKEIFEQAENVKRNK